MFSHHMLSYLHYLESRLIASLVQFAAFATDDDDDDDDYHHLWPHFHSILQILTPPTFIQFLDTEPASQRFPQQGGVEPASSTLCLNHGQNHPQNHPKKKKKL
jgi:hypothetical protein